MKHVKEHLVKPSLFFFTDLILHASPCVMKVNRFDIDVEIEGVLIEENRTARKVGRVISFMKNFVFDIFGSFLQGNDMPPSCNLFLEGIFFSQSGSRVPVVEC